jgi:hypothetical protein
MARSGDRALLRPGDADAPTRGGEVRIETHSLGQRRQGGAGIGFGAAPDQDPGVQVEAVGLIVAGRSARRAGPFTRQ